MKIKLSTSLEYLKEKQKENPEYWIGVDLDGTLAKYTEWKGWDKIGDPITKMIERVKEWIGLGINVKIFTARISQSSLKRNNIKPEDMAEVIQKWCKENIGVKLPVTCEKDCHMVFCVDDCSVQMKMNTGDPISEDGFDAFKDKIKEISKNEETNDE